MILKPLWRGLLAGAVVFCAQWVQADVPETLVDRLKTTRPANQSDILARQFPEEEPENGRNVLDPYTEERLRTVNAWANSQGDGVCALRFINTKNRVYELQDFTSPEAALASGYTVTHSGRCGSCSTLSDLAVYLETPDLTTPARACARKWGFQRIKQCFEAQIGLTPACAESWSYNALHTRNHCRSACVATYGFLNLLLHRYPTPNNLADGSLNACLQCDEDLSGPGFKYSAGRTRRNSGIDSAIHRPDEAIEPVDHSLYFQD